MISSFCLLYIESNTNNTFWQTLQNSIDDIRSQYNPKIMIIGDLNADPRTKNGKLLTNFVNSNQLTMHITEPTRITSNSETILDQIITNFSSFVKETSIESPIGSSDHCLIRANVLFKTKKKKAYTRRMWDFGKANFELYRENLANINWEDCFQNKNINEICGLFTEHVISAASAAIPNKLVTVRPSDKPWYTGFHRRLCRLKNRLYKQFKVLRNDSSWAKFSLARSKYKTEINLSKQKFEEDKYYKLANDGIKNSKKWWTLLKEVYSNKNSVLSIPPLEVGATTITDDREKAEAFNTFFLEASSLDDSNAVLPNIPVINNHLQLNFEVKEKDVLDQIQILDIKKAYGPDGISPIFIKEGGQTMKAVLLYIFKMSLETGEFPTCWKQANVIPLYKKESMTNVNNYRPVSLLCVASKVFERIVFKYVFNHFKENFIINNFQSGFQSGRSTVTQLLELYHQFCKAVDDKKEIRVVFLDIRKAFDKVWHNGILHKLSLCGIRGNLLKWFKSYLTNRMQRVTLRGQYSSWGKIGAGVPQGSVLGPLLFILYINDITSVVRHSNIRLFADDTCLFIEVDDRVETVSKLEGDLLNIEQWADKWLVSFAPEKTKSLTVSNKRDSNQNPVIHFKNHIIEEVQSHTYLGLLFTSKLSWNMHINNVEQKARKRLNMLTPLKYKLDRKSIEIMFQSFVASSMYYGIEIWGGSFDSHLLKLEQVIVDGMRLVTGATARSNIALLFTDTAWDSFATRRDIAMYKMMYKIKNRMVPDYLSEILPHGIANYNLRNNMDIRIPSTNCETLRRSFIPTGVKMWNNLPLDTRESVSLESFKLKLHKSLKFANVSYYYGQRWPSILHARLRIGCSKLNYDLSFNLHIPNIDPACSCGAQLENVCHFFMSCNKYIEQRIVLRNNIEVS